MKKWKIENKIYVVLGALIVALGLIYSIGGGRPNPIDLQAELLELATCNGLDEISGLPIKTETFQVGIETIFVCGNLKAETQIRLGIFWHSNESTRQDVSMVSWVRVDPGYFIESLARPKNGYVTGQYIVIVEHAHDVLASTQFSIE